HLADRCCLDNFAETLLKPLKLPGNVHRENPVRQTGKQLHHFQRQPEQGCQFPHYQWQSLEQFVLTRYQPTLHQQLHWSWKLTHLEWVLVLPQDAAGLQSNVGLNQDTVPADAAASDRFYD